MNSFSPKPKSLDKVKCPFCGNINLHISIDFKNKRDSKSNKALCIKKIYKNIVGVIKLEGCGREFDLDFLPKKEKKLPPL